MAGQLALLQCRIASQAERREAAHGGAGPWHVCHGGKQWDSANEDRIEPFIYLAGQLARPWAASRSPAEAPWRGLTRIAPAADHGEVTSGAIEVS